MTANVRRYGILVNPISYDALVHLASHSLSLRIADNIFYCGHHTIECKKPFFAYIWSISWKVYNCIQRPVSITQETPRGGGLDSFPKKTYTYFYNSEFDHWCEIITGFIFRFYLKTKRKTQQNKVILREINKYSNPANWMLLFVIYNQEHR